MLQALLSKWKDILLRTFDIRLGEFRRVWLMLFNIFLLIQCLWIIKPVVNAQFLSRVGIDQLPLVFLLVALTAFILSRAYSKVLHRLALPKIMSRTYIVSALCLVSFALLMQFNLFADWLSYLFYIGTALFGLITTSQFWLQANLLFSTLEAKRLFGFIGAGAIAGGIAGGYLTSLLASFINSGGILFVATGVLLLGMLVNKKIWREFLPSYHQQRSPRAVQLQQNPFRIIRNSKHLTFLALIIGIAVLVSKLVEFQFSAIAAQNIQDPGKLTSYFGFWVSTANVLALGIQILLTQKMVGFLGVSRSLFIYPGALLISAGAVFRAPVLWSGTLLKVLDISLKQSINKAATELLILPLPMSVKSQAKTYIDVFVDTLATGVGGIFLIFLINGLDFSVRSVAVLILVLIFVWMYFAFRARKEYVLVFQKQLGISEKPIEKTNRRRSAAMIADNIRRALRTGTVEQLLKVLGSLEETRNTDFMQDIVPLLDHGSSKVRLAALSILYYHPDHNIINKIIPCIKDPDDQVRARAFSCLLAHTKQNRVQVINEYLSNPDTAISRAAFVGLATEMRDNRKWQEMFDLDSRIVEKIEEARNAPNAEEAQEILIMVIRAIGFGKLKEFYPLLIELMNDSNPAIARKALIAAGNTGEIRFIPTLISFLTDESRHTAAQKALAKYNSADIFSILSDIISQKDTPDNILIQLPALAQHLESHHAVDFLFSLLIRHQYPSVKFETLVVLHEMKTKFPNLTITGKKILPHLMEEAELYKETLAINYAMQQRWRETEREPQDIRAARKELVDLLEKRLDRDLKRIFWMLGLSYPPSIILSIYRDLREMDPEMRINTVELLDNILDPGIKKVIITVIESAMQDTISIEYLERLDAEVPDEYSCYESILNGNDHSLKAAVVKLIKSLEDPQFASLLEHIENE